MDINKRLDILEGDFKLMKGELKETLSNVRDYLTEIKFPPPVDIDIPSFGDETTINMKGALGAAAAAMQPIIIQGSSLMAPPAPAAAGPVPPAASAPSPAPPAPAAASPAPPASGSAGPATSSPEFTNPTLPMSQMADLPIEEAISQSFEPRERLGSSDTPEWPLYEEIENLGSVGLDDRDYGKKVAEEASQSAPGVNLLANLIRWVATAKREVNSEQLLTLLEVYGISGYLSPELKEVILHLADITEQQSSEENAADIWSRLTLELHGILGGGDALPRIMKPVWDEGESDTPPSDMVSEDNKQEEKTLKLKLVLSSGDENKEFSIDLNPESSTPG